MAGELVVADSALRPDHEPVEWQERVLNDGSRHEVYKRYFTATGWPRSWRGRGGARSERTSAGGEVLHAGARGSGGRVGRSGSTAHSLASRRGSTLARWLDRPSARRGRCRRRRGTVAVLGAQEAEQDVLAADLAVAAALGLLERALEALLGRRAPARLGAAAVGGESTPLASIPTLLEHALEVALDRVAQLLRARARPRAGRAPAGWCRARERDEQVLRLDARGARARRRRCWPRARRTRASPDESLEHPSASSRASCGRPAA